MKDNFIMIKSKEQELITLIMEMCILKIYKNLVIKVAFKMIRFMEKDN